MTRHTPPRRRGAEPGWAAEVETHYIGQLALDVGHGPVARSSDKDTARSAGRYVAGHSGGDRDAVLRAHRHNPYGLTDDELTVWLHAQHRETIDRGTAAKRRHDLERVGLIVATGMRRPSRRGRPAIVYRIVASEV